MKRVVVDVEKLVRGGVSTFLELLISTLKFR